jgi:hypothetical protein
LIGAKKSNQNCYNTRRVSSTSILFWWVMRIETCSQCGKEFESTTSCKVCPDCRKDKICIVCGKPMNWRRDKYCSKKCAVIGWTSNKEAHAKISESVKLYEASLTDEQRAERSEKLSQIHKKRYEDNPSLLESKRRKMLEHWKRDDGGHREAFSIGCSDAMFRRWSEVDRIDFYRGVYGDLPIETLKMLDDEVLLQQYVDSLPIEDRTARVVATRLGLPLHAIASRSEYGTLKLERTQKSSYETLIGSWLRDEGLVFEASNRTVLHGKELDFYFEDAKMAIEFNGSYWHSVQQLSKRVSNPMKYHQDKSLVCRENGIRLIHIWDWEWDDERIRERIKSQVLGCFGRSNRVFARKCILRELSHSESEKFFKQNSEFGAKGGTIVTFGLEFDGRILMAYGVTFKQTGRGGYDRTALEIGRSATALNTVVVGGASRLMRHVKDWARRHYPSVKEVHYFVDFDKHAGTSLAAMGGRFIEVTPPSVRIIFMKECTLFNKTGDCFIPSVGKVYSRMPQYHSAVKHQDEIGNLLTLANAGTLHYVFDL